jgi:pyruvate/2-oxoglutarate dehydrogenase complex dihydrolipoamide acyltransferase (E2) component
MMGSWDYSYDPQVYAAINLDISKMEKYIEDKSTETGEKITLTIFIIKLMSLVLKKYPQLYGYIKLGRVKLNNLYLLFII